MEQNTEQFMEALEVSKKIEEAGGVAQAFKTIGRGIANAFGTAAGNAKRNAAAAQDAQQTAQTNAQTAQTKAQTNAMDDITLAKTINDAVTKAVGICDKGLEALNKQQPQQGEQKPQQGQPQNNQAPENSEKGGARQLNDQEEQERMGESLNFISALQEAANNNTKTFYNKAKKLLANVQQLVRPFLTGQKKFTAQDIDAVSQAINDQSVQQVLGKNDKKSLKIIQNLNAALNTKKETLGQDAQPEQQQQPQQGAEQAANSTEQNPAQNGQPTEQQQPAQGDANAQGDQGEKPTGTDGAVQKVEQRIDNAALDQAIQGLSQFSKYKPIKAVIDEWAKFKQAMEQTKQA
jgi:hypothetical protein